MIRELLFPILYGLVIFLAGMKVMEASLSRLAGPLLNRSLHKATSTPAKGLIVSALLSALLQSSTAVTVLTIGMVNAGLLTYARTLGIILGSNIGTCLTTELISLQISTLAAPLLIVALCLWAAAVMAASWPRSPGGCLRPAAGSRDRCSSSASRSPASRSSCGASRSCNPSAPPWKAAPCSAGFSDMPQPAHFGGWPPGLC